MSRSVTGQLPEPADVIVEKLKKLAVKHDIEFAGDVVRGYARGKGFHIEYRVEGVSCTLTVTKKPLLVPWAMVESQLHKLFS